MSDPRVCRLLGDVAPVETGFAFKSEDFVDFGFPVVRMSDLKKGAVDLDEAAHVRKEAVAGLERFRLKDGDYLFGLSGSLDAYGVFSSDDVAYLNQRVGRLGKVEESEADYRYLLYQLSSSGYYRYACKHAAGIAQLNISPKQVEHFEVFLPPVREQRKIAQILDTLDTQIRQTEALIAKLERIKQGLLTDLLTRGIDENGELRSTPDQTPHFYKDSPLGRIPREWAVSDLASLLSDKKPAMRSGPFGSALLKEELVESGVPLLGIDNVHVEVFRTEYVRFVTPQKFGELSRYAVRPNDLMITIMGTVGRCCLVPENIGLALSSKHTWTLTLDDEQYMPFLAMLQINYAPWVARQIARDEQGGIMSAIRSETLRSLMLPVPPIAEQKMISERLRCLNAQIEKEREVTAGLKSTKAGLMDDLLTGRVRVTPLLDTA